MGEGPVNNVLFVDGGSLDCRSLTRHPSVSSSVGTLYWLEYLLPFLCLGCLKYFKIFITKTIFLQTIILVKDHYIEIHFFCSKVLNKYHVMWFFLWSLQVDDVHLDRHLKN